MSVHWLNSITRTPRGVPTFEDATVVVAAVATAAASIIAAPGLGGVAGAGLQETPQQILTLIDHVVGGENHMV